MNFLLAAVQMLLTVGTFQYLLFQASVDSRPGPAHQIWTSLESHYENGRLHQSHDDPTPSSKISCINDSLDDVSLESGRQTPIKNPFINERNSPGGQSNHQLSDE